MFGHGTADALHYAAANLFIDELRVDDRAAVFHAPVLEQLDEAGVDIHFNQRCLYAVGEGKAVAARGVVARYHQFTLKIQR